MKQIKVIDEEELKNKLIDTVAVISDELCWFLDEIRYKHKKYGFLPGDATDEEFDAYDKKTKFYELTDKIEKKIMNKIYKYLKEE